MLTYSFDGRVVGTLTKDLANAYFGGSDFVHFGFTHGNWRSKQSAANSPRRCGGHVEPGAHSHDHDTPPALSVSGNAFYDRTWGTVT